MSPCVPFSHPPVRLPFQHGQHGLDDLSPDIQAGLQVHHGQRLLETRRRTSAVAAVNTSVVVLLPSGSCRPIQRHNAHASTHARTGARCALNRNDEGGSLACHDRCPLQIPTTGGRLGTFFRPTSGGQNYFCAHHERVTNTTEGTKQTACNSPSVSRRKRTSERAYNSPRFHNPENNMRKTDALQKSLGASHNHQHKPSAQTRQPRLVPGAVSSAAVRSASAPWGAPAIMLRNSPRTLRWGPMRKRAAGVRKTILVTRVPSALLNSYS